MLLAYKTGRTSRSLVLMLPIAPILFATAIADDQFETLRAHAKCVSKPSSYGMNPYLGGLSAAQCCDPFSKTDCSEYEENPSMFSQHFTRSPSSLQYQSPPPAKRGIISNLAIIISDLAVVSNPSALTSYLYTQFYWNMTLVWANREQWVSTSSSIIYHFLRASPGLRHVLAILAPRCRL